MVVQVKGRLLRAPPSPMMDAGVREGVLRSLNVAVPPTRPRRGGLPVRASGWGGLFLGHNLSANLPHR
jgi:hypothetical protein